MSNKSHKSNTPEWARPGHKNASEKARRDKTLWIIFGAVVAVILIAAVVIAAAGSSDDTETTSNNIEETRAVDIVSGKPLPTFESAGSSDIALGFQAPQVSGSELDGTYISLTPQDGKYLMIVFVAHWCPHCQAEVPRLVDWSESGDVPSNLDVIAVSTATDISKGNWPPSKWLARESWPWPIMADDEAMSAGNAFGLSSFPYFVILSPEGKVLARDSGELSLDSLKETVSNALSK